MSASTRAQLGNTECPDSKGIKTHERIAHRAGHEILNALIQKGLRREKTSNGEVFAEILNALIQKGLRQSSE